MYTWPTYGNLNKLVNEKRKKKKKNLEKVPIYISFGRHRLSWMASSWLCGETFVKAVQRWERGGKN